MTSEKLVNQLADEFSQSFGKYAGWGASKKASFERDLRVELGRLKEKEDKLVFLYRTRKNTDQELKAHLSKCTWSGEGTCPEELAWRKMIFFTEQEIKYLYPEFEYTMMRPHVNTSLVNENIKKLENHPEAAKAYLSAIEKFNQGALERNLLDDLRLSLELLVKSILGNNKSLENQKDLLGTFLKTKNVSKEARNMYSTLIGYYTNYQNSYVKHNNNVQRAEVDLMINLTSSFMNFLINV